MATVFFPSLPGGDVIEVEFVKPGGGAETRTLFVDSGFTGQTSFILSQRDASLSHAPAPPSQAAGALHGAQRRGVVACRVAPLSFQPALIAVFTDLTPLSLQSGLEGTAGLRFLRQFARWGAERDSTGAWRFFLCDT